LLLIEVPHNYSSKCVFVKQKQTKIAHAKVNCNITNCRLSLRSVIIPTVSVVSIAVIS